MYNCLLPEFHLTGALRRILTGVLYCGALLKLWITLNPTGSGEIFGPSSRVTILGRLNTTGRSPGIPEGAVKDRLTHCHSSLRHGTHTIGLGIFFKVYFFRSTVFCATGSLLVGCGCSPCTDGLVWREAIICIYRPWRIARAPLGPPVSPLGNPVTPVQPSRLPLTPFVGFCKYRYWLALVQATML